MEVYCPNDLVQIEAKNIKCVNALICATRNFKF